MVQRPQVIAVDDVLEPPHLVAEPVHLLVGHALLAHAVADGVVAVENRLRLRHALLDALAYGLRRVELRLLLEVADADALCDLALAHEVLVEAGQDLQQRRLTRAICAYDADMRPEEEGKGHIVEDSLGIVLLCYALEVENVFAWHAVLLLLA